MSASQAAEQLDSARSLSKEIRSAEPSSDLVLSLADDLDEVAGALQFAVEYAQNAGFVVIRIVVPGLEEALDQLADDSKALSEAVGTS